MTSPASRPPNDVARRAAHRRLRTPDPGSVPRRRLEHPDRRLRLPPASRAARALRNCDVGADERDPADRLQPSRGGGDARRRYLVRECADAGRAAPLDRDRRHRPDPPLPPDRDRRRMPALGHVRRVHPARRHPDLRAGPTDRRRRDQLRTHPFLCAGPGHRGVARSRQPGDDARRPSARGVTPDRPTPRARGSSPRQLRQVVPDRDVAQARRRRSPNRARRVRPS